MGLDMWLQRKKDGKELCYWRKANHIRKWFEDNLENFKDNGTTIVTKENLEDLLEVCKEVINNPDKAQELLPTQSGFFFGGTEYDEWYFEDVKNTIEDLKGILEDWEDDDEIEYVEWY